MIGLEFSCQKNIDLLLYYSILLTFVRLYQIFGFTVVFYFIIGLWFHHSVNS